MKRQADGEEKQCRRSLKLKAVGKTSTYTAGAGRDEMERVNVDEKFVASSLVRRRSGEKSIFTFHPESQCRQLRNEQNARVVGAHRSLTAARHANVHPSSPHVHSRSFSLTLFLFLPSSRFPHPLTFLCFALRSSSKASRGWGYLYRLDSQATWLLFFHCSLRFLRRKPTKGGLEFVRGARISQSANSADKVKDALTATLIGRRAYVEATCITFLCIRPVN